MGPAGMAAAALGTAAMAYLACAMPLLGRRRFRRLVKDLRDDRGALVRYYRRTVTRGWISAAAALAIGALAALEGHSIGLPPPSNPALANLMVVEVLILIPVTVVVFRARPRLYERFARRMLGATSEVLPATPVERRWFVGVALSAGIWEEIVYRGFALGYLRWLLPDASSGVLVVLTAVLFGWAHLYQGAHGVLLTGRAGILLGALAVQSGGLLAPIVVHCLIDLRFVLLPSLRPAESASTNLPTPYEELTS